MKKSLLITSLVCLYWSNFIHAQNWSEWVSLSNTAGVSASVSFNVKNNCGNFSYSFYRTYNQSYYSQGWLQFSFSYTDCDGNEKEEQEEIDLSKTGINDDRGQWFLTSGGGIHNIKINELYLPTQKIWLKRVNGEIVNFWKLKYGN